MLWDKQKLRLHGLPENGAEDAKTGAQEWADAVLNATDIESLTKLVDEKLADREDRRKKALIAKNENSAKRHEQHRVEQQALAEQARLKRAEDERLAEERRQLALKAKQEEEARELQERIARQQPKTRRRLESLARLLESPDNICVAVVMSGAKIYAATNKGALAPLSYASATLRIANVDGSTGVLGERTRERDARKVSHYISEGSLSAEELGRITQVGSEQSDSVHAEMKILNWLVGQGKVGTIEVYVSKLCCNNCRIAIDEWNKEAGKQPKINTPGGHGNYFLGWTLPACIGAKSKLGKRILARIRGQESDTGMDSADVRGRSRVRDGPSQRERSVSPAPEAAKIAGV